MPRFFVPTRQMPVITGSDVHHLRHVLRLQKGDALELVDGTGTLFQAVIDDLQADKITCKIIATQPAENIDELQIDLAQALPKAQKMDLIIQKCTELGVHNIIPVITERTIAKNVKIERWGKIAQEAAKQSGRLKFPEIYPLHPFENLLAKAATYDLALLPWELEKENSLKKILAGKTYKKILVLIGPEGGFSQNEVSAACASSFIPITLGPRILRTETAGMAVLAMLDYAYAA